MARLFFFVIQYPVAMQELLDPCNDQGETIGRGSDLMLVSLKVEGCFDTLVYYR